MHRPTRSLFVAFGAIAVAACASPSPTPNTDPASGYDLKIDGNDVALRFTRDLTVPEFLQLAQQVTSSIYVYPRDIANAGPVRLTGSIRCPRSEFPTFVGTMLTTCGLQAESKGTGDRQYVEVQPARKS